MKYVRPYKRWEKAVLWLFGSEIGLTILAVPLIGAMAYCFWRFGWHAAGYFFVASFAFILGWNMARRKLLRDGFLNKL